MKRNKVWRIEVKRKTIYLRKKYKTGELLQSHVNTLAELFYPPYCIDDPALYAIARFCEKHKRKEEEK